MGADGSEGRAIWPAAIDHQTSIGRDDIPRTQCRIISNGCVGEPERVPAVAGAAGDDLLAVRERGGKLRVALAVCRDRVIDAVAVVDPRYARRTKRAAGLRRTCPAMTLNWKVTSVAQAHAIDEASLGTGRLWAAQRGVRIRITGGRRIPQAAEQRLENVLGRGRSYRGEKRRDGDADHEDVFDAAAQAGLATDQQNEGSPDSRADDPQAHHLSITFGGGRKYDLSVPGVRRLDSIR